MGSNHGKKIIENSRYTLPFMVKCVRTYLGTEQRPKLDIIVYIRSVIQLQLYYVINNVYFISRWISVGGGHRELKK